MLFIGSGSYCQEVLRNFAGFQFGGQGLVGLSYDRTLIKISRLRINGSAGWIINEYADDQDPADRPMYGLNVGVIALYHINYVSLEAAQYSSPYFYKSLTFMNYYSWLGLRVCSPKTGGAFVSVGWTPSLHFSKQPPNHYNEVYIGVKLGVNF